MDINMDDCSNFVEIYQEYQGIRILYNLFQNQQSQRDYWSKILWNNFNPPILVHIIIINN